MPYSDLHDFSITFHYFCRFLKQLPFFACSSPTSIWIIHLLLFKNYAIQSVRP